MRRSPPWRVLLLALLAVVAGTFALLDRERGEDPLRDRAEALREEIRELQDRVDDCLERRGRLENRFQAAMRRTEGLRERVEQLEALDSLGVPAERYGEYLEAFDDYNESIPEWERLGEALREQGLRCRRLAEVHNERLELLREILIEVYSPMAPPV